MYAYAFADARIGFKAVESSGEGARAEEAPPTCAQCTVCGTLSWRRRLRDLLQRFLVPDAQKYGTQDFRRGHAEDMRKMGCTLAEILKAGQWRSAAFMKYMDEAGIDKASFS